ncbi:MAG TPA: hypothetical protein VK633_03400 [Verrucomicrobiae bacterium]|nr:hypothetical protein [Verrucomicrobiae bacterium]
MKATLSPFFFVAAAALFSGQTRAEPFFIAILRGEKQPVVAEYQRVAFVGSAQVKNASGTVERLRRIDSWEPLRPGAKLQPGDMIRTQAGSSAILEMAESRSLVKVTPNTILRLASYEKSMDPAVLSGTEERTGFVVRSCRGKALYRGRSGEWSPVLVNTVLAENSFIRADANTLLDLYSTTAKRSLRISGSNERSLADALLALGSKSSRTLASALGR